MVLVAYGTGFCRYNTVKTWRGSLGGATFKLSRFTHARGERRRLDLITLDVASSRVFLRPQPATIICRKNSKLLHPLKLAITPTITRCSKPIPRHTSTDLNATLGPIGVLKRGVSRRPTMVLSAHDQLGRVLSVPLTYRMLYSLAFNMAHRTLYSVPYSYPTPISKSILLSYSIAIDIANVPRVYLQLY